MSDTSLSLVPPGDNLMVMGGLCGFVALGLGIVGMAFLFTSPQEIVGGDAYNYQIATARGIGFICGGILMAVLGAFFGLAGVRRAVLRE